MPEPDRQPPTLPGYTLTSRLGAGGYGEVWLAQAPGGLTKAVKYIYGSFNDRRAEHELRSLHRIKSVRHPFLLSLERIEVVDDRLAIVTELADSSLKDRYDECRRQGLPGIPRDELLGYMHDAAEALDYLGERHSLQHLDVKPENLLLVAGHIKVADFGLVKEVGKTQASLVGGLTPLYSSPEVFQGTPGARSDQYSLAVVYQEMLTGTPPLAGANAAELTMQHLQGEVNVLPLPMQDRFPIARALAKDPAQRFANCRAMVEALLASQPALDPSTADANGDVADVRTFDDVESALPERRAEPRPGPIASILAGPHAETQLDPAWEALASARNLSELNVEQAEPQRIEAVEFSTDHIDRQPTVVIGIGGTAASVMRRLRARLVRELGDAGHAAVEMLLLDSDPKAIALASHGDERQALRPDETLTLPLRRPQEYREDSALLMRWLSRRWLYNIPKSLRTEGLRPLGRLALVDQAERASERIAATIQRAKKANESTSAPRIYVVASSSGGTGSGMSLDVGYGVQAALATLGIADAEVIGVFLHSTGRDSRLAELARVNSCAWLREYNHYHRAAGTYPGDEACGLPPFPASRKAFDAAYFVDLGSNLEGASWDEATSQVAEYLYLDAATPAQRFFDACRAESAGGEQAALRSFAVTAVSVADDSAIRAAALLIVRSVVGGWLGIRSGDEGRKSTLRLGETVERNGAALTPLDLEALASRSRDQILEVLKPAELPTAEHRRPLRASIDSIDAEFAAPEERHGSFAGGRPLEDLAAPSLVEFIAKIVADVMGQIDARGERLAGAQAAIDRWRNRLQQLDADATKLAGAAAQQAAAALVQIDRWQREQTGRAANGTRESELCDGYRRLRIDQHALTAVGLLARRLLAELRGVADRVGEVVRQLKGIMHRFPMDAGPSTGGPFGQAVVSQLAALCERVDQQLDETFLVPSGGLLAVVMGSPRGREQLGSELVKLATRQAEELASSPGLASEAAGLETCANVAEVNETAKGLRRGSTYAVLETRPGRTEDQPPQKSCERGVTTLTGVGSQTVRCIETWNLLPLDVALDLIQRRRDCIEFADRVASRCDVSWTPLVSASRKASPVPVSFEASPMAMTHVL